MDFSLNASYVIYTQPYVAAKAALTACSNNLNAENKYNNYIHLLRNTADILNACADSIEYKNKDIEKI